MSVEAVLKAKGYVLPPPFPPAASYGAVRRRGDLVYVSGHGPMRDGAVQYRGKLGRDLDVAQGRLSAELTMLNILATLDAEIGLERVTGFVKLLVLVNATEEFAEHHLVAEGASALLLDVFGPTSIHARSAIGAPSLPFGIATEIEAIVEVSTS